MDVQKIADIAVNALDDNGSAIAENNNDLQIATNSSCISNSGDSSMYVEKRSKYRESVDSDRYRLAKIELKYNAYQDIVIKQEEDGGPIPIVAFFAVKLRFPDLDLHEDYEYPSVQFQHKDILSDRIFLIAVTSIDSSSDIYSVFVNKPWFEKKFDHLVQENKVFASSTPMFKPGEIGNPEEYLEILSRNKVHELQYRQENHMETFELTGTLDTKGQKWLLLHLMQEAIYDPKRFLLNQLSSLEQQRIRDQQYGGREVPTSTVDDGSNSGGQVELDSDHAPQVEEAEEEIDETKVAPPQSGKKTGSNKNRALQAIQTNLRYGHLSDEQSYEGKRVSKQLIKFGSVNEDSNGGKVAPIASEDRKPAGKSKVGAPPKTAEKKLKPIAVIPPTKTTQKATMITTKTTKPATSTTSRRKRVRVKIEPEEEEELEEEDEDENEEEVQIVVEQKRNRGRPPTRSSGAVLESSSTSNATSSRSSYDFKAMQREYEMQLAKLRAETEKAAKQTVQQTTAAVAEALAKFSKDADERTKTREMNEQQVVISTSRGNRSEQAEAVPRNSGFTAPTSAPSNHGFADTMANFTTTRCSSQTANQLQLMQQSALQLHSSSSFQLQNNSTTDGMSNNLPSNMPMWGSGGQYVMPTSNPYQQHQVTQQPQHQHFMQQQPPQHQQFMQPQHQHFMQQPPQHQHFMQQPPQHQHFMQPQQQHFMQQPSPQYQQQQQFPMHGMQHQSSRRHSNNANGALAAFLAGMLANTQQQDD